jgi:EutQ-like cupin domain
MRRDVRFGNAAADGAARRGWFVGHFMDVADGLQRDSRVEVKWGYHQAGETRAAWVQNEAATTLSILVRGRFRLTFAHGEYLLEREGDYVLWPPGVAHHWRADEDSIILTVRWPSEPGDSVAQAPPL